MEQKYKDPCDKMAESPISIYGVHMTPQDLLNLLATCRLLDNMFYNHERHKQSKKTKQCVLLFEDEK